MNKYDKQASDFLEKAHAKINIDFIGFAVNTMWKETERRALYRVTISTPRGQMEFDFWDSLFNTKTLMMTKEDYAKKRFRCKYDYLNYSDKVTCVKELARKKEEAKPSEYDVLACMTHGDPGTFANFCADVGYDEDSMRAMKIYFAVQEEWNKLCRIFTSEQLEELAEIS